MNRIQFALPIKCLEAVVLASYLTISVGPQLTRIPVAFKSEMNGNVYRHIVLVVKYKSTWGALGLSRKNDLMYKPLKFESLHTLIAEFLTCYTKNGHLVSKVKLGLPILVDTASNELIQWKHLVIDTKDYLISPQSQLFYQLDKYTKLIKTLSEY